MYIATAVGSTSGPGFPKTKLDAFGNECSSEDPAVIRVRPELCSWSLTHNIAGLDLACGDKSLFFNVTCFSCTNKS